MRKDERLCLINTCKKREDDIVMYKYNAIELPQFGLGIISKRHQKIDKVYQKF